MTDIVKKGMVNMKSYFNEQEALEELLSTATTIDKTNRIANPFQALTLKMKIIDHFTTSANIKFGNLAEEATREVLESYGARYLKRKQFGKDLDNYFEYEGKYYLIEQKMRDDHDSSKKVGQMDNYRIKKENLPELDKSFCWFIDPLFNKNKKYYSSVIGDELCYGEEINNKLVAIFGNQASTFFQTFYNILMNKKQDSFSFAFDTPVRLEKINLNRLYIYLKYRGEEETYNCFFAGKNMRQELKNFLSSKRTTEAKKIMELFE